MSEYEIIRLENIRKTFPIKGGVFKRKKGEIHVLNGVDLSIRELAETMQRVVYPEARLVFDPSKPDGAPRKLLDVSRLAELGWRARVTLAEGIDATYRWYLEHLASESAR